MARSTVQTPWALARQQHSVVTRRQLVGLGFTAEAIDHRIERGRLHQLWRGVYAVGRREISREGELMAAVLACGDGAVLSHGSAAELWAIRPMRAPFEVTVPYRRRASQSRITIHRRATTESVRVRGIPLTSPTRTLLDLATRLQPEPLERAVNEAINHDLTTPTRLRAELERRPSQPGVRPLRTLLDRHSFQITDTILEQRMLAIARRAGLPLPETQVYLNGYRVDFFFRELGIVVEADSLRFHRTPAQQATDRRRDQAHAKAGLVALRFTHWQICKEPAEVAATLAAVAARRRAPAP